MHEKRIAEAVALEVGEDFGELRGPVVGLLAPEQLDEVAFEELLVLGLDADPCRKIAFLEKPIECLVGVGHRVSVLHVDGLEPVVKALEDVSVIALGLLVLRLLLDKGRDLGLGLSFLPGLRLCLTGLRPKHGIK